MKSCGDYVSVIMPCFNGERWLKESIESVLNQSYLNFELILVDDGSTDSTWEIINSYKKRDKRIVAIQKNNSGSSDSVNFAIRKAKYSWISRLDQDDLFDFDKLSRQMSFLIKNPNTGLLGSGFYEINALGKIVKKYTYPSNHRQLLSNLESMKRFFPHSSVIYKKDLILEIDCYNTRLDEADDWYVWLALAEKTEIACIYDPLVFVRSHPLQRSNKYEKRYQILHAIAGTVCYFLRKKYGFDPSRGKDSDFQGFIKWLENNSTYIEYLRKRQEWLKAKKKYNKSKSKIGGFLLFTQSLISARVLTTLTREFFFGTNVPKILADQYLDGLHPIVTN